MKSFCLAALVGLALAFPFPAGAQQAAKPAVVISLAPLEEQVNDALYLGEVLGFKEQVQAGTGFVPLMTKGIDPRRPLGAFVMLTSGEPAVVACVPVTNVKDVFKTHEAQLGRPEDLGGGLFKFETPGQSVFIKDTGTWAFVSNSQESLAAVPADPLAILGDLPKQYNLAVKANLQDIPAELRDMFLAQIESGLQQGLENADNDADREFNKQWGQISLDQIKRLFQELDSLSFGWNINPQAKTFEADVAIVPVKGSDMAAQAAAIKDGMTTSFAGFLMKGASANLLTSSTISKADIESNAKLLKLLQERAEKEIENDAGLDANLRVTAKDLLGQLFEVIQASLAQGKVDYGALLQFQGKSLNLASGVSIVDGKKLEAAFIKLVDLAKDEPDFPEVQVNVGKHGDINLHRLTGPVPDNDAQKVLGEKFLITIGISETKLYWSLGAQGEELLKKSIDASKGQENQKLPPGQLNVYMKPIMAFAASMDEDGNPALQSVASSAQQLPERTDEINVVSSGGDAIRSKATIREGVLKMIGDAIRAAQSN